jgi:hypothetical protein
MKGDETRRLLQEAHSIRRYESPAPLGGLLAISRAPVRDLDAPSLRARWHSVFRRKAADHLPRHLLIHTTAYRRQV